MLNEEKCKQWRQQRFAYIERSYSNYFMGQEGKAIISSISFPGSLWASTLLCQLPEFFYNLLFYCAFHKHSKAKTIALYAAVNHLNGPLKKQNFTLTVKRSRFLICDWWISIRFVCFCVSMFVACDRNYDWRQRKTQLWRWLLNFRVRMFVKSVVTCNCLFIY